MKLNVKKLAIAAISAMTAAASGHAQTAYDAFLFSENNYEGTARSVAMGNAFTALGGDLGSIGLNPAGSAVAKYSQISLTPSLTISSNTTQGVSPYQDGSLTYFQNQYKNTQTRFALPNLGLTFNWNTDRATGIRNMTFGFVINRTNSWNENVYAAGTNGQTSFMGAMAVNAENNGCLGSALNQTDAYDYYAWKDVVGYQSGMISTYGGYDDRFVGASELIFDRNGATEITLGGPLEQSYGRQVKGSKYDYMFNFGMNISDFIYIGANLAATAMDYGYSEYFKEVAVDPADFEIGLDNGETLYFDQMKYRYDYNVETSGVYAKIGVILTPGAGFRFGAAIQTPTLTTVREEWQYGGETAYTDSKYNASASSPYGEDKYQFSAPYRANFGVAYTLGSFLVLSADYELCDYSKMKFKRDSFTDGREYFNDINSEIKTVYGTSHMFRAGGELKLGSLAIRAGYGLTTSPEKSDLWGNKLNIKPLHNASFGFGYASKKSFFADVAARYAFASDEYFMPYDDYIFDDDGNIAEFSPEILNRKDAWKVLLTIGWRF